MHTLLYVDLNLNYRKLKVIHMSKRKIICLQCKNECFVEAREINRGNGKFCSRACSSRHRIANLTPPEPNVICSFCRQEFYMSDSKKKNSKSGFYFCCRKHKDAAQCIGGIQEIMPAHYGTGAPANTYRRTTFAVKEKICERCGYDQNEAAIIVHHKDRNRSNDDITNLEVLCCNCHAIEHWGEEVA